MAHRHVRQSHERPPLPTDRPLTRRERRERERALERAAQQEHETPSLPALATDRAQELAPAQDVLEGQHLADAIQPYEHPVDIVPDDVEFPEPPNDPGVVSAGAARAIPEFSDVPTSQDREQIVDPVSLHRADVVDPVSSHHAGDESSHLSDDEEPQGYSLPSQLVTNEGTGAPMRGHSDEPPPLTGPQRVVVATLHRPRPRGRGAMLLAALLAVLIVVIPVAITRMNHEARPRAQAQAQPTATGVLADLPLDDIIHVAGRLGATPVVRVDEPLLPTEGVLSDELIHGQGPALVAGKPALLSVSTFSGVDGSNTTGTESGTRLYVGLLEPTIIGEQLAQLLEGVNQGTRLVLRAPASTDHDGSKATEEEITVVDVLPLQAQGQAQEPLPGMPPLVINPDGTVGVTLSGVDAPTKALASTLIKGEGEQVKETSTIVARYALISWNTGAVISSSWGNDVLPSIIQVDNTMTGVAHHLVDVTVGSRVIMALPPDQASGEDAVLVVMDVLAIDHNKDAGATVKPSSDTDDVVVVTPTPTPVSQSESSDTSTSPVQ